MVVCHLFYGDDPIILVCLQTLFPLLFALLVVHVSPPAEVAAARVEG